MNYYVKKCAKCEAIYHPNDVMCQACNVMLPPVKHPSETRPPPPAARAAPEAQPAAATDTQGTKVERYTKMAGTSCLIQGLALLFPFFMSLFGMAGFAIGMIGAAIMFLWGHAQSVAWRCGNCKNPLHDKSVKVCPVCKNTLAANTQTVSRGALIGTAALLVVGGFVLITNTAIDDYDHYAAKAQEKKQAPSIADLSASAKGACMLAIKQTLHDPGSAEFPPGATAHQSDGETWIVRRPVRAKNAFGAYRLAEFECQMLKVESGWLPVQIAQVGD